MTRHPEARRLSGRLPLAVADGDRLSPGWSEVFDAGVDRPRTHIKGEEA